MYIVIYISSLFCFCLLYIHSADFSFCLLFSASLFPSSPEQIHDKQKFVHFLSLLDIVSMCIVQSYEKYMNKIHIFCFSKIFFFSNIISLRTIVNMHINKTHTSHIYLLLFVLYVFNFT